MAENYYDILGITEEEKKLQGDAFKDVCSKKFKKLGLKYHPDRHINDSEEDKKAAEEMFKKINQANTVLSDPAKRRQYDMFGDGDTPRGGFGFDDFFSEERRVVKGEDVQIFVDIDIEAAFNGGSTEITYQKGVKCTHCDGTGSADKVVDKCPYCNGTGVITQRARTPFGEQIIQSTCPHCHGVGKTIKNKCRHCNGTGIEMETATIKINIPKNVSENTIYPIQGMGSAPAFGEGINGDLHVIFRFKSNNLYSKENENVVYSLEVTLKEAWLGCKKEIKGLDGKNHKITIDALTPNGKEYTFKNEGFGGVRRVDMFRTVQVKGDFIVRIKYKMPKKLTKEQESLIKEFYDLEDKK